MMDGKNRMALLGVAVTAGLVQVVAGVAMYLAGIYFKPYSMLVSIVVLLVCIVIGTQWFRVNRLSGIMTYLQALGVGCAIALGTGLVYAAYNMVSISFVYPHFLDEMVRARLAQLAAAGRNPESFAAMRAGVTATAIAVSNCIRLTIIGSVLSALTSCFTKKP